MKAIVKFTSTFLIFDTPLRISNIKLQFLTIRRRFQDEFPGWSTLATQQKMVYQFWYKYVTIHFSLLSILSCSLILIFQNGSDLTHSFLPSILIYGLISFAILYIFNYRPIFISDYLPKLQTIKEIIEQKQFEQLEKCRRDQLSNLALILIFHAFDKANDINSLQCNDQSAELLKKLFGIDGGSIKKNLLIIYGRTKTRFFPRKQTEIYNSFEEAFSFLETIQFQPGIRILKNLWLKFQETAE